MTDSLTSCAVLPRRFLAASHAIGADRSRHVTVIRLAHRSTSSDDRPIPLRTGTSRKASVKSCQELFQLVPERVERAREAGELRSWINDTRNARSCSSPCLSPTPMSACVSNASMMAFTATRYGGPSCRGLCGELDWIIGISQRAITLFQRLNALSGEKQTIDASCMTVPRQACVSRHGAVTRN